MMSEKNTPCVLVTGGAGYIGAVLTPKLLAAGYRVKVLDLYLYGDHVLGSVRAHPNLEQIQGDIRDPALLHQALSNCDFVIHLACISNDPSFELDPTLGRFINYDAFEPLVRVSRGKGVKRFIYASTSSVYGISDSPDVTEDHPVNPITDYSKYKALCETVLLAYQSPSFTTVIVRPATACGYSPRQRLDLIVNILTNHAVNLRRINIFGGPQLRANIHIEDITDLYAMLLKAPCDQIAGKIFNAGCENHAVAKLAEMVRDVVEKELPGSGPIEFVVHPTDDERSYHISSERVKREIGFAPRKTIKDAIRDLIMAFREGKLPNALTDIRYYNIKTMKVVKLPNLMTV